MAHPILASYSTYSSSSNETSHPIPKPAGTQAGDLLVFDIGHSNTNNVFTPPGALENPCVIEDQGSPSGAIVWGAAFLIAGAGDPSMYTFQSTHSGRCTAICHRITGHLTGQEATPLGVISAQSPAIVSDSGVTWRLDEITPAADECLGLYLIQNNGNGVPIDSTSSWTTLDSLQSGGTITAGSGQKNLLNPPVASGDAFGDKGNNGRYYGKVYAIAPAAGVTIIDLDLGHIDAKPTVRPLGLVATANLGLGYIDSTPIVRALSIDALTAFALQPVDARATVWPLDIEQPTPATDLDFGHIDARPAVHPLEIVASAQLDLGTIDARALTYPLTLDALTAFGLQSINARATVWPLDIQQPGVATDLDFGHIDARPAVHPLDIVATGTLLLQPIDARAQVHPVNLAVIAEINLAKIEALATIYELGIAASAEINLANIDARATLYPMQLEGPIQQQGDIPLLKIIGPRDFIKVLANRDFIKILR